LAKSGVAVEKLDISEIRANFGDRKCLIVQRKSFVGHPDAIQFPRISGNVSFSTATDYTNYVFRKLKKPLKKCKRRQLRPMNVLYEPVNSYSALLRFPHVVQLTCSGSFGGRLTRNRTSRFRF